MSKLSLYAIVPAAGLGRRMGGDGNKAWLDLGGRSVLERTLDLLYGEPRLAGLVLVGRPSELEQLHSLARHYAPEPLIVSGVTRQDSRHGLRPWLRPAPASAGPPVRFRRPLMSPELITKMPCSRKKRLP